jgi:ribosome-associated protein
MRVPSNKNEGAEALSRETAVRALHPRVTPDGAGPVGLPRRARDGVQRNLSALERVESGRRIALLAAAAGLEKKAENIQIIDVVGKVDYAEYLVLMTGASDRNVAAIARGVEEELRLQGVRALALEGLPLARWVLIDFVDVVVHVFQSEWREMYDLDGLWMDASRVPLPAGARPPDGHEIT